MGLSSCCFNKISMNIFTTVVLLLVMLPSLQGETRTYVCVLSDVTKCTNSASWEFFTAGKDMTKLCKAAAGYYKCLTDLTQCKYSSFFFIALRLLNDYVTVDDCPGLLTNSTSEPSSNKSTDCPCSASISAIMLLLTFCISYFISEYEMSG